MADGGYAFRIPASASDGQLMNHAEFGMTLRDYFAAQAITAAARAEDRASTSISPATYAGIAARCYFMADAMLLERNKGVR